MSGDPEAKSAKTASKKLVKNSLKISGCFTDAQISVYQRSHKVKNPASKLWSRQDYTNAFTTKKYGKECLLHVRKTLRLPLPASSTLLKKFNFMHPYPGMIKSVLVYLKALMPTLDIKDRLSRVLFDETKAVVLNLV